MSSRLEQNKFLLHWSQTNGLIPTLFEDGDIGSLSKLALVNAIYFKGNWKFPFGVEETRPMNFTINQVIAVIFIKTILGETTFTLKMGQTWTRSYKHFTA